MERAVSYQIGDKVQAYDGRIGTVIDTEKIADITEFFNYQIIVVKFPDQSTMEGSSENFKAVSNRFLLGQRIDQQQRVARQVQVR